jgi:cephalosporin-C deacetylase-like acetyl esterase
MIARLSLLMTAALLSLAAVAAEVHSAEAVNGDEVHSGNAMICAYLAQETAKIQATFEDDFISRETWESRRPAYYNQYMSMLGLSPLPERTPLKVTITRTFAKDDYAVDMLHFQSCPQLYVTGNLYRPAKVGAGEKLPAVIYVCGHANRGRDGNKTAYQSHGIWFAKHGYICLVLDSLQLGEIAAYHHGTFSLGRMWWHSRGYTPAGVEAWNGIRAIDYLFSRPDVDHERLAVTGISGGGAATFWIAAADDRVKVAVPVSGMADLHAYVDEEFIDKHCDCMFFYNSYRWPWTRIAAMVAARPLLLVNSDQDPIFPLAANERIAARLEQVYKLYGAGDRFDAVFSVGGHGYRPDIRQAAFRFINTYLKNDPRPVTDSEDDAGDSNSSTMTIPSEQLRVFPTDADLPADELNTTIDQHFVPIASPPSPETGQFESWRKELLSKLRASSFTYFPESIPPARKNGDDQDALRMCSEEPIEFRLREGQPAIHGAKKVLLAVLNQDEAGAQPEWVKRVAERNERVVYCEPRGIGATCWTPKRGGNENYVERSLALIGRTVDAGRVWDVIAAAKYLEEDRNESVRVAGRGSAGVLAAYAAALEESIDGAAAVSPCLTHMAAGAPQFLNVLRVCDVPDALGLIAPRPLLVIDADPSQLERTKRAYSAAGGENKLSIR